MVELEGKISGINKQIAAAERIGNKTKKTQELIRLNSEKTNLIAELNGIRTKYRILDQSIAPNLATNLTVNEFSSGVEKTINN